MIFLQTLYSWLKGFRFLFFIPLAVFLFFFAHYCINNLIISYTSTAASPFSIYLLPEFFFVTALHLGLLIYYACTKSTVDVVNSQYRFKRFIIYMILLLIIFLLLTTDCFSSEDSTYYCMNLFRSNALTDFLKIFAIICTLVILLFIYNSTKYYSSLRTEHIVLIMYVLFGGYVLLNSIDFLTFYLALEIFSIPTYILVAANSKSNFSTEAGLKYFIIGSFSSGIILFGFSFIYGATGCSTFEDAYNLILLLSSSNSKVSPVFEMYNFGVLFLICGLLIKMGVPPFHLWVLDVYTGAPTNITLFLMTVPKIILWGVLYSLLFEFGFINSYFIPYILLVCIFSSFVFGNIPGLYQTKIKRLLIYSSLGTNGFFLLALLGNSSTALVFYLVVYIIALTGFFSCYTLFRSTPSYKLSIKIVDFTDIYKRNPALAICMAIMLLSLAGLPPFIGFFAKYYIFYTAFHWNGFLVLFALFSSTLSMFYYLRIIKWMFFSISGEGLPRTFVNVDNNNFFFLFYASFCACLLILLIFIQPTLLNLF